MHAVFGRASQAREAEHAVNLILAHQKIEPLGVLGNDLVLAVLDVLPVQLARAQAVNAVFFSGLQVVINFSVEQQSFCGDAANVEAGAAELVLFFNEAGLQTKLAGAESGRVSAGASADDGNVINSVWQNSAPSGWKIVSRQTSDCKALSTSIAFSLKWPTAFPGCPVLLTLDKRGLGFAAVYCSRVRASQVEKPLTRELWSIFFKKGMSRTVLALARYVK